MKRTIDTATGKLFRWNTTALFRRDDGSLVTVPARSTPLLFTSLHPDRVEPKLLAKLNSGERK
jgi:hypothetical protein